MGTKGGIGEHQIFIINGRSENEESLTRGKHYVAIDAVSWFVNRESSWFKNWMASGTLQINLSDGLERYHAALGTFELAQGNRFAPVFDRPVLPDRNYRGGPITLTAAMTAIKKDTAVGAMLRSAANASLNVIAGMVQTATLVGPTKLLSAASEEIAGGVSKLLSDSSQKREAIFDFAGMEFSIRSEQLHSDTTYAFLYRGQRLSGEIRVQASDRIPVPLHNGEQVNEGAWLLLRIRRSSAYSGVREWYTNTRLLRGRLQSLIDDVRSDIVKKTDALKQFKPSGSGDQTIFDEYSRLRFLVMSDGVLSEREAAAHVAELKTSIDAAKRAISEDRPDAYRKPPKDLHLALLGGGPAPQPIASAFEKELVAVAQTRQRATAKRSRSRRMNVDNLLLGPDPFSHVIRNG